MPAPTAVNVVPDTVQTAGVEEAKVTAPVPEPPEVESAAVPPTISADTGLIVNVA